MRVVNQPDSTCECLMAMDASGVMARAKITRRSCGPKDVAIKILFAGMCHSDVHQLHNDWMGSSYPMVPGHEIFGVVTAVGSDVTAFTEGQRVGVGCMVDSCRACATCRNKKEQYCGKVIFTYNSAMESGELSFGGYSDAVVVDEHFVVAVPDSVTDEVAAPILCAGITVFSPLHRFGIIANGQGKRVGVAGLGGLGQMAVKIAKAAGAEVTVFSRSYSKREKAESLGASIVAYSDADAMAAAAGTVDVLLDTIAAFHELDNLCPLLVPEGTLVRLGVDVHDVKLQVSTIFRGLNIAGSLIGGMEETRECMDFCGQHGIFPDCEVIPASKANWAIDELAAGRGPADGEGRFVIDVQGTLVAGDWQME